MLRLALPRRTLWQQREPADKSISATPASVSAVPARLRLSSYQPIRTEAWLGRKVYCPPSVLLGDLSHSWPLRKHSQALRRAQRPSPPRVRSTAGTARFLYETHVSVRPIAPRRRRASLCNQATARALERTSLQAQPSVET